MGKRFLILILFLVFVFSGAYAQRWKKYPYEFSYGIGGSNFMGDIGAPEENFITRYIWINPRFIRPVGNVGLGYKLAERTDLKGNLHIGWINGNDEYGRWDRNLKFTSLIMETSAQIHFYILGEKPKRNIYRSTASFKRQLQNLNVPTYLILGVGGTFVRTNLEYIDPSANTDIGGEKQIGKSIKYTATIPFGIGFRYKLSTELYIGLEATMRYTLSDKIDSYVPSASEWVDAYQYLIFSLNYKLKSNRRGLPNFK